MVTLWVVNASPVILLARVGQLDLLNCLGASVVIPDAAVREVTRAGPNDPAVQALSKANWLAAIDPGPIPAAVAVLSLGDGEAAVLTHALANPGSGATLTIKPPARPPNHLAFLIRERSPSSSLPKPMEQLRPRGRYSNNSVGTACIFPTR